MKSRIIEGFNGKYSATEDGRIINNERCTEVCQWKGNAGYMQCVLTFEGKKKYVRVHRIIAILFVGNIENKPMVNHIDGNKINDNYLNLEWCTNKENVQHFYDNNKIEKRSHSISIDGIIYKSIREASEKSGLNRKTISSILKGDKKNNYGVEIKYV